MRYHLHPSTLRLLLARCVRSLGQGILVVDLSLYLHALGWSAVAIGSVLSVAGVFGAVLNLAVGVISDRLRRKPFLMAYEAIIALCSLAALISERPAVLASAIVVAGFGRGAGGAAGPFSSTEQAWLAEKLDPAQRGWVYSLNSALGFFGMGAGAFLAILPAFFTRWTGGGPSVHIPHAGDYRPLFALVALASAINVWLLARTSEEYHGPGRKTGRTLPPPQDTVRRQENSILAKLVLLNSFNGVAIGLVSPLISYWFARRFQVGPYAIAPVMSATFVLTGFSTLIAGKLSERFGIVRSVVWARSVGLVLLVLLPLAPVYWLAALLYLMRSVFNRGTVGARQALTIGLVRDERRGLAASLNTVSMQIPQSVGPTIFGYLMYYGRFALPFYLAAVFQVIYVAAYRRVFRNYDFPHDEE
jgi:predicted MFS family arabinose efflux permease